MKTCKKVLAVVLSLCMILSVMVFSVSAEDAPASTAGFYINSAKATKLKADDSETVMQVELEIKAYEDANGEPEVTFDTLNKRDEFNIHEGLYAYASAYLYSVPFQMDGGSEEDLEDLLTGILDKTIVAKAKPVSFENGILTLDIYSKDGQPGAKMVSFTVENIVENFNLFVFEMPEGMLKDSSTGTVSEITVAQETIEGLTVKEIKIPSLIKGIMDDVLSENYTALIIKAVFLLPFLPVIVPMLLKSAASSLNEVYSLYGLDVNDLINDALDMLQSYLPQILSLVFSAIL